MSTYSSTNSYTVADIEKVMRSVKADLIIIATTTKAMTEDEASNYAHDIELLAKKDYLKYADVTLMNGTSEVRAIKYEFQNEGATGTERPGGVTWPRRQKTKVGGFEFIYAIPIHHPQRNVLISPKDFMGTSSTDTSHKDLTPSAGRGYSSNGFGTNRKDFS
jgi:hypothetical protein